MRSRRVHALALGTVGACALMLCGCSKTHQIPATAIVVLIDAEQMVQEDVDRLVVEIASGPTPEQLKQRKEEIFDFTAGARWPVTLTLVAKAGDSEPAFRIWAHAQHEGKDLVDTRAISGFAAGRSLLLELLLSDGCIGMLDCDETQTCVAREGRVECVDANRDVESLGRFKPEDVKHLLERDAGTAADSGSPVANDSGTVIEPDDAGRDAAVVQDAAPEDAGAVDSGSGMTTDSGTLPPEPDPEQCWNGIDDDGDGHIDCADSDCDPKAVCVPAGDLPVVVLTDITAPCPAGYTQTGTDVVRELLYSNACNGCNCTTTPAANCTAEIYFYDQGQCNAAVNSGGVFVGYANATCTTNPIGSEESLYSPYGWRVGNVTPTTAATCNATGSPTRLAPIWNQKAKLCRPASAKIGSGCKAKYVCAPKASSGTQCSEIAFAKSCTAGADSDWYTGYDDRRACPACTCALAGGDCSATTVRLGSDYTCGTFQGQQLGPNQISCFAASVYSPDVDMTGGPTAETCSAGSTAGGQVLPTGGTRLCCN